MERPHPRVLADGAERGLGRPLFSRRDRSHLKCALDCGLTAFDPATPWTFSGPPHSPVSLNPQKRYDWRMADEWQDIPENDGLTLGPEEALEREIVRSKALKVERLQLRDRVEKLEQEVRALTVENQALKSGRDSHPHNPELGSQNATGPAGPLLPARWALYLLAFNLTAIGLLLFFLLNK